MTELRVINAEPVDQAVVEYAEHILARAKTGEFSAIAFAYVYRDGTTGSGFSPQHNLATSVGAVACLKAKLLREMLDV